MKYDYTPQAPYLTLESPASQHPPLWPLFGAILARLWESKDTFQMLKVLSLATGLGVWLAFLPKRKDLCNLPRLLPFGLAAVSPWLVDFSTNGSPYILIALILLLAERLWWGNLTLNWVWLSALAGLCALAILTHPNLTLLPLAFALKILTRAELSPQKKALKLAIFCGVLLIQLSPYWVWNRRTFGQWFHSPSVYYLLEQLQIATIEIEQNRIVWSVTPAPFVAILQRYSLLFVKSAWAGIRQYIEMITPLGCFFLILALISPYRSNEKLRVSLLWRRSWLFFFSPIFLYLLTISLWATYKTRFLIPFLPISFLVIGKGIEFGQNVLGRKTWLLWFGVAALFVWTCLPYRQTPLNFYYGAETPTHAQQYDQMRNLAKQFLAQPKGVVLGVSNSLDGGIETIYWTEQPFVMARGMKPEVWKKLAKDFQARYLWSDCPQRDLLQQHFPTIQLLLFNELYCVLILSP